MKLQSIIPELYEEIIFFVHDQDNLNEYIKILNSNIKNGNVDWYVYIFGYELNKMKNQIENLKNDRNFTFNLSYVQPSNFFNNRIEFLKKQYMKAKKLNSWNKIKKFDYEFWQNLIERDDYNNNFDLLDYIMDGSEYSDQILKEFEFIENKKNHEFILQSIKNIKT